MCWCHEQAAFAKLTAAAYRAPPADRPLARCFLYSILFHAHVVGDPRLLDVTPPVRDLLSTKLPGVDGL